MRRAYRTNLLAPALVSVVAVLGGCEAPPAAPPRAWVSLTTMQAAYNADPQAPIGAGLSSVFSAGFPASYFLSAANRIRLSPVYTDGQQMAYMTTDVWVNFQEIWLQPLYVFVSAWDERPPRATWVDIPWVATVSDSSAFWSPFWRVYYVVVPADTPRDRFRSARDVISSGLPSFPGQARLLTLQPPGGIEPEDPSTVLLPELRAPGKVGRVRSQAVWVEGERDERLAMDFGENRFEWNERYEIREEPLFFFFTKTGDGQWQPLTSVPRVGGTGPLFERRPAIAPSNRPRFGSNWRLWSVRLPPTARLFVPPDRVGEWEAANRGWTANLTLATIPPVSAPTPAEATAALDHHAYKVLLNGDCLARPTITVDELGRCPWLDSQQALEQHLPASLLPGELLVACPFLSYGGAAVPESMMRLTAVLVVVLAAGGPAAWAQEVGPPSDVPSLNDDLPGYVPDLEPPALTIGGYVDIGFADADGDGTSFHPEDRRLPLDYGTDSFATAVNSRGDVASREAQGRFTNAFLPRSAGVGGRPSFLLNTVDLDVQHAPRDSAVLVFVRLQFLPRLTAAGSETRVLVEQAFGRLQPFSDHELMLFVGKVDSVFGIEYLENQAPLRTGVTPSLLARYTTGTALGAKLLYRLQIAPLLSAVSVNVAATNNAPFSDALQASEASLPGRPVLSARAGYELNLPGFQLKLGGSGMRGPRNDQADREALQRGWGADLRAYAMGINLGGEYLHLDQDQGAGPKLTGAGPGFIASGFRVRGFWTQLSVTAPWSFRVLRRTVVYGRGEQRRAWFEGFSEVKVRRLTLGARLDLWESLALKGELLLNREIEGAPDVANDVWAASAVWSF